MLERVAPAGEIAAYLRAHATEMGVTYVIWQNHYDHVHVSVR